jgi:hypothetical protein
MLMIREFLTSVVKWMLVCGVLGVEGCGSSSTTPPPPKLTPPGENGGMFRRRNEGYSLLYKLMLDESQVGGIFIIKHADDSVGGVVKEIGLAAKDAQKQLHDFPNPTNRIEFDVLDLPRVEQDARDLESKEQEKQLLTSSGQTFELRLLLTQIQAMGYVVNLCKALVMVEDDPGHINFLNSLSKQCDDFRTRMEGLLVVKSP